MNAEHMKEQKLSDFKYLKYHIEPNSFIHFSYFRRGTAYADDFVFKIAFSISSAVIGPGLGVLEASTASDQFSIYMFSI